MAKIQVLTLVLPLLGLFGCAALAGHPEQVTSTADLKPLSEYLSPDAITKFDSPNDADRDGLTKRQWRDRVIDARVWGCPVGCWN